MSTGNAGPHCRGAQKVARFSFAIKMELPGVFADLGTVLLTALCLAGVVIVLSTFDGDLQGSNEILAAILTTLTLLAVLAALELTDRIKGKRYCRDD